MTWLAVTLYPVCWMATGSLNRLCIRINTGRCTGGPLLPLAYISAVIGMLATVALPIYIVITAAWPALAGLVIASIIWRLALLRKIIATAEDDVHIALAGIVICPVAAVLMFVFV